MTNKKNKKDSSVKKNKEEAPQNFPATSPEALSAVVIAELEIMRKVFAQIEKETADVAEELFEYLFEIDDLKVMSGEIPLPKNKKIRNYIKSLNKLFQLSRRIGDGAFKIINRKMVQVLDKKTYLFCMCVDGGVSLDVLCEIVNQENIARTPTASPVKITVRQFAAPEQNKVR